MTHSLVGVDEVGRGCLAGPLLVVAARERGPLPGGIKDSKLLTRAHRETLLPEIIKVCDIGEGWVKAVEIDRMGLARAMNLGVRRALINLSVEANEEIVIDGNVNYLPKKYKFGRCEVKADNNYPVVAAASIYAKVTRDKYMFELSERYPDYAFAEHVGYGTPAHYEKIRTYGPLNSIHRLSFAPFNTM